MAGAAELARKANGDVRLDYRVGGIRRIRLWEPRGSQALETTFREDGAILLQTSIETSKINEKITETMMDSGASGVTDVPYKEVVFDRSCPWCSKHALVRFADAYRSKGEVPIVPLYQCKECRGRSYYLTDEYLVHLIESNPQMFDQKDVERFQSSRDAFVAEMKAYIISSFASKRVKKIE